MDLITFLVIWLASVSVMTLFSILVTHIIGKEVRESVLLHKLLHSLLKNKGQVFSCRLLGWIIHYAIGIIFLLLLKWLWVFTGVELTFVWSVIFGVILGILGVFGWMTIFYLHPQPPKIKRGLYYAQLIIAHICFAITGIFLYRIHLDFSHFL